MAAYELKYTAEEIDGILESVDQKTVYDDATQSEHGLMSTTDKAKLDSLPTSQQIDTSLSGKVDKINGKGLSTYDYDKTAKDKVDAIPANPKYTDTTYEAGDGISIEGNVISATGGGGGGEENVIEAITMNGDSVPVTNKTAAITETDPTVPSWAKQPNKPSYNYSEIGNTPDLSGFITKSVNDLTNYYLKSETYTKAEVAALIGAIQQFHYEIYASLPSSGESNVLYLIGPTGSGSDKYEEYVYSNNAFTKIGDTSIDLSGYVTTSALNTALAVYTPTSELAGVATSGSYNDLTDKPSIPDIIGKADKVQNATNGNFAGLDANGNLTDSGKKASDFATASQGVKADTAYQKPSSGIPESDLSSDVQQALQKHFKGWYASSSALPANPVVGDYAYVKGAETTDPAAIYECNTVGSWSDSGRTVDVSNVQTFQTGEQVNSVGIDDEPTAGSENLVTSGGVKEELTGIDEIIYGEGQGFDPVKAYFTIQRDSTGGLDFHSVWDNTNIKNEAYGSCTIDFGDGSSPVSIVDRDSMAKGNVPAGTYTVCITGITSVLGNTMFRESILLIDAKLPSTLTSVTGWLFNGVSNMSEVTFMGTTPPTFSGGGISSYSLNLVSKIKVPKSALSAYQSSTMSNAMKAKLEAMDAGIVGDITEMKADVTNLQGGLVETNETVQELADYVDSKLPAQFDKTKTYFTIEVSAGNRDLRTIYNSTNIKNETPDSCSIDFGDGTPVVTISSADDLVHNYAQAGTYTLIVTGLTGLTSNLLFHEMSILKDAKFGNTFVNPSTNYMLDGVTMESVTFFATTPISWGTKSFSNMNLVNKIIVPKDSLLSYLNAWYFNTLSINKDYLTKRIVPDEPVDYYYKPVTVTVGQEGDFTSLNDAIQSLSTSYPVYQPGGLKAVIKILSGTTIAEQVYVDGLDLSWITIEYEGYNPKSLNYDSVAESIAKGTIVFDTTEGYNSVAVDATNFGSTSHDQRGDFTLFRAENGARLPIIGCVFKLTTPHASTGIAGIVCNRGSEAVVKTLCGFIGFNDGVISNNESSITIREGITLNCSRWGCHARHNGEVSARSVIATGCATNTTYSSEYGSAVADRVADMDVREAYLSGNVAIRCNNASTICARATHVIGGGVANSYLVEASYSGKINASNMTFSGLVEGSGMFKVLNGGWIDAFEVSNKTYNVSTLNTIDGNKGVIFG